MRPGNPSSHLADLYRLPDLQLPPVTLISLICEMDL